MSQNLGKYLEGKRHLYGIIYYNCIIAVNDSVKKLSGNCVYKADLFSDL